MTKEEKIELVAMLTNNFTIDETNRLTELLKLDRNEAFKQLEQKIQEQKGLLESALAIAKRKGENTYWKGFIERIEKLLNKD